MERKKLIECCQFISDGDHLPPPKSSTGVPFITISNFTGQNKISFEDTMYVPKEYYNNLGQTKKVQKGDILYSVVGSFGKPVYIDFDEKFVFQRHIAILRPNENVNGRFLYYTMLNPQFYKLMDKLAIGCSQRTVTLDTLRNVEIELPDKSIQDKIVSVLSFIDEKITMNCNINDNLQQQMKLLYDYWFTQFDFPDTNGNPYRSSGGQMVWNDELKREIPVGWTVKTLSELFLKNSKAFDYLSEQPTIDLSVMPSDSIALSEINSSSNFTTNLYWMQRGDILFGSIRPYLHKAGFAPCDGVVAGTVHSYKVKQSQDYNFALMTLCRDMFFDYAVNVSAGTKMPVVSSEAILSYKIAYSQDIVSLFNEIDLINTIANNIQENLNLKATRDWLLPMLMNGQATVSD